MKAYKPVEVCTWRKAKTYDISGYTESICQNGHTYLKDIVVNITFIWSIILQSHI